MFHQMNHPPVVELERLAGCRYMLVTAAAKRARQILAEQTANAKRGILGVESKPVAQAVEELYNGKLEIDYPDEYYMTKEI